jgi:hypothetical protein
MCYIFVEVQFYNVYIYFTVCFCVPHCLIANWHWRTQTAGISHHGVCRCSGIWPEAQQLCYKWGKGTYSCCPLTVLNYLVGVMGLSSNKWWLLEDMQTLYCLPEWPMNLLYKWETEKYCIANIEIWNFRFLQWITFVFLSSVL